MPHPIHGFTDPGFETVRAAFEQNFAERDEIGAAVSVVIDGKPVVDLWGGYLDEARIRPWGRDAIGVVWSIGKAVTSIALLQLVDDGLVDLEAPVARHWPEFAQAGKATMPVKYLLSHQAGLPAVRKPLPPGLHLTDWDGMCAALAGQEPWWEPGTRFGYHTNTFGFLAGEIVRRLAGKSLGTVVRERIAEPLGAEFFIGFGPEHDHRVAEWLHFKPAPGEESQRPWLERDPATLDGIDLARVLAYRNPPPLPGGDVNSRPWRAAEYPSTNPHSNARSIATIFGELACDGGRLLSAATIDRANTIEADGEDAILGRPNRFGLGFQLTIPGIRPFGPNPRSFGHYGNGAVIGFADPTARLGFAYVCNRAGRSWRDPRNIALIDAVYTAVG
jgi:CubicO group peptidase (beta-lactamase class C family)